MTQFIGYFKKQFYPLLEEQVDVTKYNTRKIHHIFHQPSRELEVLIINFAHHQKCAVPAIGKKLNRRKIKQALQDLVENNYIQLFLNHYHNLNGAGRARVYQRTTLFENTFKFRLPKRIIVTEESLDVFCK